MDWRVRITMTGDLLDRIVALLLSIADLAERAAFAPDDRRRLALAFIRSAETVAIDAFGGPSTHGADRQATPAAAISVGGDRPEDALALAMSLRALALVVCAISASKRRLSRLTIAEVGYGNSDHRPHRPRHRSACFPPDTALPPIALHDTS